MQSLKISKNTLNKMKGLSKFIYIATRIVWIFMTIITILIALVGTIVVLVWNNLELYNTDGTLNEFGTMFDTTITNNFMNTYNGDLDKVNDAKDLTYDLISPENRSDFVTFFAVVFIAGVAEGSILIFLLIQVDKLFKNIAKSDTPFNKENPRTLRILGWGMIVYIITQIFFTILINATIPLTNNSFKLDINLFTVALVFVIFAASYIFTYAYELQKNYISVAKEVECKQ